MLLTIERPSGTRTAIRAWQSLFVGLRAFWPLFLGCIVLLIAWAFAAQWLSHLSTIALHPFVPARAAWLAFGIMVLRTVVHSVILAPIAVAMHRFILLGETRAHPLARPGVILHFAAWLTVLRLPPLIVLASPLLPTLPLATYGAATLVLGGGLTVLMLWLTLLFPAIAVEDPATGAARLETALERTVGNFWLVVRAIVIAFLPIFVLTVLTPLMLNHAIQAGVRGDPAARDVLAHITPWLVAFRSCIAALSAGLGAGVASWIYSYAVTRPARRVDKVAC
jgi:hypothetical protein